MSVWGYKHTQLYVATFGIGQLFGATGSVLNEALRAGTHGLASGITTSLSGGKFFAGFLSGASSSAIGSFAEGIDMSTGAMIGCTTLMGGLASWSTGGDFWQGAMNGLQIGVFNHEVHRRKLYDRELKQIYDAYVKTSWKSGEIVPVKELCERIGGDFFYSIADEVNNSCAIRLSVALNASGYEIPNLPGTHQGGDGKFYFIKASDINNFLKVRFTKLAVSCNPNKIKNGIIFECPGNSWIRQNISGHVDVVYRKVWASHVYTANYISGDPYNHMYKTIVYH